MTESYFGTDGVRGPYGEYPITPDGILALAYATGQVVAEQTRDRIAIVGRDPRTSSLPLARSACHGLAHAGFDVLNVEMLPTPGIAYLAATQEAVAIGVAITASHNPGTDNGFKLIAPRGGKVSTELEAAINDRFITQQVDTAGSIANRVHRRGTLRPQYSSYLSSSAGVDLSNQRIVLDGAHGAARDIAPRVFKSLGADVLSIFCKPDGILINKGCGATDTRAMRQAVAEVNADFGLSFDGDADRVIMASFNPTTGESHEVDGDAMLYVIAKQQSLDGIVATVMTNAGIEAALKADGIDMHRVAVGDRHVAEGMREKDYLLGGEQSGHIIDQNYLAMGDGIHTGLLAVRCVLESERTLESWRQEVNNHLFPQKLTNVLVRDKEAVLTNQVVQDAIAAAELKLGSEGRVVLRPSGTEPKFRILVEARDERAATKVSEELTTLIHEDFGASA